MHTDTLIVGGGLAGLSLADKLHTSDQDFLLAEARDRLGGRIETAVVDGAKFDLGPAWFWDGQPRMSALVKRFELTAFEQFYQGDLSFEDERGVVQRGKGFSSMQGSYRLQGGLTSLVDSLADSLPVDRVQLGMAVTRIQKSEAGVIVTFGNGKTVTANRVVLALPPRVAVAQIEFIPALPQPATQAMENVATWMAGQAKAVAVYSQAFWRDAGLSGDAMSRTGPMVEIHDASPAQNGPYALFGFIGVPAAARQDQAQLEQQIRAQLIRLFGPHAGSPQALFIKDWAYEKQTATVLDHAPLYAHPQYGTPAALRDLWHGSLNFASTEMAPRFGGYLEGALEASENIFDAILLQKVA